MNAVNRTLYIPLYGKAYVSRKGLFLKDPQGERIWDQAGFKLRGKAASKWLAYYMGIRAAVFDDWVRQQMQAHPQASVIHIGCGLDSRVLRTGPHACNWYDVDFPQVIRERERFYQPCDTYRMIPGDIRAEAWLEAIPEREYAIILMEGVSMYLTPEELSTLARRLSARFDRLVCLMDAYTPLAARLSARRNPVREVGVARVYGLADPAALEAAGFTYLKEHSMTPQRYSDELRGLEKALFRKLYAGAVARKMYRLFEYEKSRSE